MHLNGREKEAYNLLKEKGIMSENDMEPWQRVAVKNLKDFASPIHIKVDDNIQVIWRHNLVSEEKAKLIISEISSKDKDRTTKKRR